MKNIKEEMAKNKELQVLFFRFYVFYSSLGVEFGVLTLVRLEIHLGKFRTNLEGITKWITQPPKIALAS